MKQVELILYVILHTCCNSLVGGVESDDDLTSTILTSQNTRNVSLLTVTYPTRRCDNLTEDNEARCIHESSQTPLEDTETTTAIESRCNDPEHQEGKSGDCEEDPSTLSVRSTVTKVITYVGYVTVPLFLVLSLSGNCLTLIVMFSKKFWNSPCSVLLIALALSDSTYSIVFPFSKLFVRELIGYDPRALTEVGCHVFFIIHKTSKMASSWFIVAICIERFIAVWFPLNAKIICSKRNTMCVAFFITIGLLVFDGFWTFSTKVVNGICVPNYATKETAVAARAYLIAGSTIFSVIPATILMILTPAICAKLHHHSKIRSKLCNNANENLSETTRANAMLLAVTIAYIALVTPTAIGHNVCYTLNINFYESKLLSMSITRALLQVMEQLNFSINFFLYVMCNRSFRNRVVEILNCRKQGKGTLTNSFHSNPNTENTRY